MIEIEKLEVPERKDVPEQMVLVNKKDIEELDELCYKLMSLNLRITGGNRNGKI